VHWTIFAECYIVVVSFPVSNAKIPSAKFQSEIHSTFGQINNRGELKQERCKEKPRNKTKREV
jgi:hypothetical protein